MTTLLLSLCLAVASASPSDDWPGWRGPNGNGVAPSTEAPLEWDAETHVLWRIPLKLPANGSPIVVNGRIFLTTPEDAEGKQRSLYCYDRSDGKELWKRTARIDEAMPTHRTNPYCGTTPASDGTRVVVWHASAGLYCYDLDGEELWQRDLGEFRHIWGYGTSPVLYEGKVLLNTGPGEQPFVAAFDLESGETLWRTDEPEHRSAEDFEKKRLAGSWCTPLVASIGGEDLILCSQATRLVAYEPADGSIRWWCSGLVSKNGDLTYSSPTISGDICLIVGGYEGPTMGVRLDPEAKGDITESHRVWHFPDQMSNCASAVAVDGHFYIPDMNGFLFCIEAATGAVQWRERVGRGSTWGSVVQVGQRLYLMNQAGVTHVFEPNPKALVVVAENELDEQTNSTPAFSDGQVFLRTHEHLYCIGAPDSDGAPK